MPTKVFCRLTGNTSKRSSWVPDQGLREIVSVRVIDPKIENHGKVTFRGRVVWRILLIRVSFEEFIHSRFNVNRYFDHSLPSISSLNRRLSLKTSGFLLEIYRVSLFAPSCWIYYLFLIIASGALLLKKDHTCFSIQENL